MNNVMLIGNLTKDVEVRYASSGENHMAIGRFSIAINSGYGDRKRVDYINIVTFGKTAENCEKWLRKGSKCSVRGRIQTGSYEGKNGKVYTTDVIADEVEFLTPKKEDGFTAMSYEDEAWS